MDEILIAEVLFALGLWLYGFILIAFNLEIDDRAPKWKKIYGLALPLLWPILVPLKPIIFDENIEIK